MISGPVLYQHTQSTPEMIAAAALCVVIAAFLPLILRRVDVARPVRHLMEGVLLVVCSVVVVGAILFSRLTVRVTRDAVAWHFTGGALQRSVDIHQIAGADTVTNSTSYGWGEHSFRGGTLYNIAGSKAVALWLRDGSQVRIGTDEPTQLLGAIQKAGQ